MPIVIKQCQVDEATELIASTEAEGYDLIAACLDHAPVHGRDAAVPIISEPIIRYHLFFRTAREPAG